MSNSCSRCDSRWLPEGVANTGRQLLWRVARDAESGMILFRKIRIAVGHVDGVPIDLHSLQPAIRHAIRKIQIQARAATAGVLSEFLDIAQRRIQGVVAGPGDIEARRKSGQPATGEL